MLANMRAGTLARFVCGFFVFCVFLSIYIVRAREGKFKEDIAHYQNVKDHYLEANAQLQKKYSDLELHFKTFKTTNTDALDGLKAQLEEIKDERNSVKNQLKSCQAEKSSIADEKTDLSAENADLLEDLATYQDMVAALHINLTQSIALNGELEDRIAKLEAENKDLKDRNDRLQAENKELKEKNSQNQSLKPTVADNNKKPASPIITSAAEKPNPPKEDKTTATKTETQAVTKDKALPEPTQDSNNEESKVEADVSDTGDLSNNGDIKENSTEFSDQTPDITTEAIHNDPEPDTTEETDNPDQSPKPKQ